MQRIRQQSLATPLLYPGSTVVVDIVSGLAGERRRRAPVAGPAAQSTETEPETSWTGTWVTDRLGITLRTVDAPVGLGLVDLVGLAVRRNPRRAHLLVSTVLGKHVPTDPRVVYGSGLLLGTLVAAAVSAPARAPHPRDEPGGSLLRQAMSGVPGASTALLTHVDGRRRSSRGGPSDLVVLGYAETATALAHAVADALGAPTLHSTRRPVPGISPVARFEEEHSHATSHLLLPEDPTFLAGPGPLVLTDDELSTGTTVLSTIMALHTAHPRSHYVIATLVDLRSDADRARVAEMARELGVRIDVVALAAGRIHLPVDVLRAGQRLAAQLHPAVATATSETAPRHARVQRVAVPAPPGLREGGRHGFTPVDRTALEVYLAQLAQRVGAATSGAVHVLAFEELMYAPLRLAQALAAILTRQTVTYSSTTRTPALPLSDAGYPLRSRLVFPAHDDPADGPGDRYAYNLAPVLAGGSRIGTVVLVVDAVADTPELHASDGLLNQLAEVTDEVVLVVLDDHRPAGRVGRPTSSQARAW